MFERYFALKFINTMRVKQGMKPLKKLEPGAVRLKKGCPLAVSLAAKEQVRVGHGYVEYHIPGASTHGRYKIPKKVQQFIKNFDAGKYPDLILKEEDA